ncbi:MAG TPA: PSP1 C-terminal domain-containing protein [Candidatus Absconditabacterales bacterium]|nr:PSP1 C-terminal domain-containing protein [Candidatus Absconditabacterales bacterium]
MLYVLDRLTIKPVLVQLKSDQSVNEFKPGDQIIYSISEDNKIKYMLGHNIGYVCDVYKEGQFVRRPREDEQQKFIESQAKVQPYYELFKSKFKEQFPNAKPISVRADINGTTAYFYFNCEERLNFIEFLKEFRPLIPFNFFFYQVGARDMVRLHPQAKEWLTECGCGPMGCCSMGALPTIDMENVVMQSLEGRDIEKLKGRCGKLKCSVVYERYRYLEETTGYPKKGDTITWNNQQGRCIGHNAILGEIVGKTEDGFIFRAPKSVVTIIQKAQRSESVAEQLGISAQEAKKLVQE